ncbi:MAG: hypothetical protein IJX91_01605 [Clostridia bacterium]|nr:hypothetical protein [Clostridia bacterium]
MLKALLKKQFLETASFFFLNAKDGKRRSPLAILGFGALILYGFGAVVAMFWMISGTLCAPLTQSGLDWVYFAFMITLATSLGCVGSVFAAKSKLFEAKDNDFLLSLPVPAWAILFTRILSLYLLTFLFEALVLLPAAVRYFVTVGFSFLPALFQLLLLFILPLGTLAVCSLLGWLIAIVTARIRSKNLLTVLFFAVFMVAYFLLVGKMNEYLGYIVLHGEAVGQTIKTKLFPFWQAGLAALGEPLALLVSALIFGGLFALVYLLLAKTFYRVVTVKRGEKKTRYKERKREMRSAFSALLKREALRFFKNPMIALNCLLGSVFLLILPVIAFFNADFFGQLAAAGEAKGLLGLLVGMIVCAVASMNFITASSVSLEGETLWLVRSLPVETKTVFATKLSLHVLVTAVPALLCTLLLSILLKLGIWIAILIHVAVFAFVFLCAATGLAINLKFPNLRWTNEVAAVKQSVAAILAMVAGIGAIALLFGGYFLFGKYLPAEGYAALVSGLLVAASVLLCVWLGKRGVKIFENL